MYETLKQGFRKQFGREAEWIFSAPGRTELSGNHTDHQHGCVLAAAVRRVVPFAGHWLHLLSLIAVFGANLHPITGSNSQGLSKTEGPLLYNFCFLRLPDVLGTRFTPAIYLCGLSSDGLRRLLSRSDDP